MSGGARFKVDEDLPREVADVLRTAGHDASTVHDQAMTGWPDDRLFDAVASEGRSLVTADIGFADARRLIARPEVGIVLLRLWPESRAGYIRLAESLIASFDLRAVPGCIVTVTPEAIRVHDTRR